MSWAVWCMLRSGHVWLCYHVDVFFVMQPQVGPRTVKAWWRFWRILISVSVKRTALAITSHYSYTRFMFYFVDQKAYSCMRACTYACIVHDICSHTDACIHVRTHMSLSISISLSLSLYLCTYTCTCVCYVCLCGECLCICVHCFG